MITHAGTCVCRALRLPCATSASVITPIVFCASLVPWAIDSNELEAICPTRNPRVTAPGRLRPTSL